jgi:2-phosphosulfolactate phosphatase
MRVHVAFTPAEAAAAPVAVVVDVIRATSTIAQALAAGYERVLCCAEVEEAETLRGEGVVLGGERSGVLIPGFDLGNSPEEMLEPRGRTLVMTTTNGTRAIVAAAARCDIVLVGSLLNLGAVVAAARESGEDVAVMCAGVGGAFTLDDAYCAGRIVAELGGEPSDAAVAAMRLVSTFASAEEGLGASRSAANLRRVGLEADVAYCARESVLQVVPRLVRLDGVAAEIAA